ncbi:MAG: class I SAM-dependent methyltransferase [Phycisphaerales bacterium]
MHRAAATPLDRHALYELCAQSPARDAALLAAIHGRDPRILGEDFCGTAALSRAWAALSPRHRAIAVDHDPDTLAHAPPAPRVELICADVRRARSPADLLAVLNYSIGELPDRRSLVAYLRHARDRLRPRGCLVCDLYGGADAMLTGKVRSRVRGPRRESIDYTWEQRSADPLTGRVVNAMHFVVRARGKPPARFTDAFVYHWRLWSIPELREAMLESGFDETEVFNRSIGAIDDHGRCHTRPVQDPADLGDSFSVYVVGRATPAARGRRARRPRLSTRGTTPP